MEYSVIGKSLPRTDGPLKARGEARYAVDLELPKMLHGLTLRSPLAHARIVSVDISRAERLPGVQAVITGKDTIGRTYGTMRFKEKFMDEVPLAVEKVRFIGDPVAAVAAVDEETALEALSLISVEYEELPAVFTPQEAAEEDAPEIHDHVKGNVSRRIYLDFGDQAEKRPGSRGGDLKRV